MSGLSARLLRLRFPLCDKPFLHEGGRNDAVGCGRGFPSPRPGHARRPVIGFPADSIGPRGPAGGTRSMNRSCRFDGCGPSSNARAPASAGSIMYTSVTYTATRVCTNGSSGMGTVARHQNRRTNSPLERSSVILMSSSSNGIEGAGPAGPVCGNVSGSPTMRSHRPCSGPGRSTANDTVEVVSSRPSWRESTRRAAAVRPSKTDTTEYSTGSPASPPRRNCRCMLVGSRFPSTVRHAAARLCATNWPPNARLPSGPLAGPIHVSESEPRCNSSSFSSRLIELRRLNPLPRRPIRRAGRYRLC